MSALMASRGSPVMWSQVISGPSRQTFASEDMRRFLKRRGGVVQVKDTKHAAKAEGQLSKEQR